MLRYSIRGLALASIVAAGFASPLAAQESYKEEMREHPRIVRAIRELEDAISYMEKAPHDFGGHKAKAIADSRAAIVQLREAIKYRVKVENKKK